MTKKTKIVATVGPASESIETLSALIEAGVNLFRLNFSHGTYDYHETVLSNIRQASEQTGKVVGVLQDISGPKIRIGELESPFHLEKNDLITFHATPMVGKQIAAHQYETSINYPKILSQLTLGDYIYLYDGVIRTKVIACDANKVSAVVENEGILSSKKGVNFPSTRLEFDILTPKDRDDIAWGVKNGVDYMAISFVQNAQDMVNAREIVSALGGKVMLIAKIEKFDAVENIDTILEASDGLMVARGDLGIEVPYYEVPTIQKMLIQKANAQGKPIITATQMLLSMTHSPRATRAEISDVANAVLDGTDAVMLSEESAMGDYPLLSVQTMTQTILEAEKHYPYYQFPPVDYQDVTDAIDEAAVRLGKEVGAAGIISLTSSGKSAKKLSKYRPHIPIFAITHEETIRRQLTLSWGIEPLTSLPKEPLEPFIHTIIQRGVQEGSFLLDQQYVLTSGHRTGVSDSINTIELLRKGEMLAFNAPYHP